MAEAAGPAGRGAGAGGDKPRLQCPSARCGSFNYEVTNQGVFCSECGAVIEESSFDLSVSFTDNQDGSRSMNGQFVSNMCTTPYRFAGGAGGGFSRESREVTIANGKKRIQQLASALKLNHFVDAAHRLFLSAVQRNFVHGRKTANVVAACLYIVCRQRNAPHLLIDFSDVLQTNVYVLGNCFLKFRRLLNLELPAVDPVHYIDRFAAKLEFGDKTHDVAKTAHKLVARMKRDWIQTGRRPSGVCGAALIMSARMHGFHRTQREVVNVMKICEETLRKRLVEFEATPSGSLTVEEFLQIDLPQESNPPAFTRNREREQKAIEDHIRRSGLITDGETGEQDAADVDGTPTGKRAAMLAERSRAQAEMYKSLEQELAESLRSLEEQEASFGVEAVAAESEISASQATEALASQVVVSESAEPELHQETSHGDGKPVPPLTLHDGAPAASPGPPSTQEPAPGEAEEALALAVTSTADELSNAQIVHILKPATIKRTEHTSTEQLYQSKDSNELVLTTTAEEDDAMFDGELNDMVLKPEEQRLKSVLWQVQNKAYLEKERQDRLEGKVKRKRKRKSKAEREAAQPGSAAEATRNMVESRPKFSKKINYDAWEKLFQT